MTELPNCLCGLNAWEFAGSSIGGLTQENYQCSPCSREAVSISAAGGNILVIARSLKLPEHAQRWINVMVLPTWRANCEAGVPPYGVRVPLPPRVPDDAVDVWVRRASGVNGYQWEHIDPAITADLPVPIDPIRVRHDALFGSIFRTVGLSESIAAEIPNRYYNDYARNQPWYLINIGEMKLIVGPRKRVISIEMTRRDGLAFDEGSHRFDHTVLGPLAESDGVTYESSPHRILIHAWGKDKAIEYLSKLLGAAVPVLDRMSGI